MMIGFPDHTEASWIFVFEYTISETEKTYLCSLQAILCVGVSENNVLLSLVFPSQSSHQPVTTHLNQLRLICSDLNVLSISNRH